MNRIIERIFNDRIKIEYSKNAFDDTYCYTFYCKNENECWYDDALKFYDSEKHIPITKILDNDFTIDYGYPKGNEQLKFIHSGTKMIISAYIKNEDDNEEKEKEYIIIENKELFINFLKEIKESIEKYKISAPIPISTTSPINPVDLDLELLLNPDSFQEIETTKEDWDRITNISQNNTNISQNK